MAVSIAHFAFRKLFIYSLIIRFGWLIAGLALITSAAVSAAAFDSIADRVLGQPDFTSNNSNQGGGPTASTLYLPFGMAVHLQSGRIYVSDSSNNRILSWRDAASFTNGQAADKVIGQADFVSNQPNRGLAAPTAETLNSPRGIRVDIHGNLYVCDSGNNRILEYDNPAINDTVADRVIGQADMNSGLPNRGLANPSAYTLNFPGGLAFDSQENLWIADSFNNRVLKYYNPLNSIGAVVLNVIGQPGYDTATINNGGLSAKSLYRPFDVAIDSFDDLLIADAVNNRVLGYFNVILNKFTGADSVFGQPDYVSNQANRGGAIADNALSGPVSLAFNSAGRAFISDSGNNRVLELPVYYSDNAFRVFGQPDFITGAPNAGGPSASTMAGSGGLAFDANNNLYVADYFNNRVLEFDQPELPVQPRITQLWPTTTPAGSPGFSALVSGRFFVGSSVVLVNGSPRPTQLVTFTTLAVDIQASDLAAAGDLLISVKTLNQTPTGFLAMNLYARKAGDTLADAVLGQPDFASNAINTGGRSARSMGSPQAVAVAPANGRLWVCDSTNARVLSWPNAASFANGQAADFVLGQTDAASFVYSSNGDARTFIPVGIAIDAQGNVYVSDSRNRILEFDDPISTDSVADRVFGQPNFTATTPNTNGISASSLNSPRGIALDGSGRLYVADVLNNRVLIYNSPLTSSVANLVIGQPGFTSNTVNNGGITANSLQSPSGVTIDSSGRLYIADSGNSRVLEYDTPLSGSGIADRVFGHKTFTNGNSNEGGIGAGTLSFPTSVGVAATGELYVSDTSNRRLLEYDQPLGPSNAADRVFGQGDSFTSNVFNNGGTSMRSIGNPQGIFVDSHSTLFVCDSANSRVLAFDRPVNHAPTITSAIAADPAVPIAGAPVHFTATAADIDPDVLSYHWDFGDGSSTDDTAPTHVYATSGTYTVNLTVADNAGGTATSTLSLIVADPLTITKLQIKLNFAKANQDSIALAGTVPVPQGFAASGQVVTVDVGGATETFTLSTKGTAKSGLSTFKLQLKSQKGTVAAQTAKFSANMKGSFAASLADEGLVGTATVKKQPLTLRVVMQINGGTFEKVQPITYSAVAGKTGSAK